MRAIYCSVQLEGCKARSVGLEESPPHRSDPPPLHDRASRLAELRDALAGTAPAFHAAVARLAGEGHQT